MTNPDHISKSLLNWYDRNAREMPWRYKNEQTPDPYRVWLSEVMLQQTTVAVVRGFFQDFTTKWPRVQDLANAELDDVLHAWQGLGYYARARNLHKCAQVIAFQHQGQFPSHVDDLIKLPGVGPYTAAAISAIAFNRRAVAVDGNVERVFARVLALEEPLPPLKKTIAATVAPYVPHERAGDYTQALMDLGATLCSPKKPNCLICPLMNMCQGFASGVADSYPKRLPKKARPERETLFFWIEDRQGNLLVERRPEKGLLGGMSGIPSGPWIRLDKDKFNLEIEKASLEACGSGAFVLPEPIEHIFTHFKLTGWVAKCVVHDPQTAIDRLFDNQVAARMSWWPKSNLAKLAFPTCMKKVVEIAI